MSNEEQNINVEDVIKLCQRFDEFTVNKLCQRFDEFTVKEMKTSYTNKSTDYKLNMLIETYILLLSKILFLTEFSKSECIYRVKDRMNDVIDLISKVDLDEGQRL